MNKHKDILLKDKWTIFLKFYNTQWKPYFYTFDKGVKVRCYDYKYAKTLFNKLCKNFNTSQWMLVKVENIYSNDEFVYIEED